MTKSLDQAIVMSFAITQNLTVYIFGARVSMFRTIDKMDTLCTCAAFVIKVLTGIKIMVVIMTIYHDL